MNQALPAPTDASAIVKDGKVTITKSVDGKQYNSTQLLKDYQKQLYKSTIHLQPSYTLPIKEDSPIVKKEADKLHALLKQSLDYKVQDKVYTLQAKNIIKNASFIKHKQLFIKSDDIHQIVKQINKTQSTLNKYFQFKTHNGSVISVKGEGYGWQLDTEKETDNILTSFEKGEKKVAATHIIGHGWNGE